VRAIARGTRVDRKTVAKYIAAGVAPGLCRRSTLPTDAQVAAIIAAIRPPHIGRPAALAERLTAQRAQVEGLAGRGAAVEEDLSAAGRSGRADSLQPTVGLPSLSGKLTVSFGLITIRP
jgi:hypothetical protein